MAASCAIHIFVAPQPACQQWEPPPRNDEVAPGECEVHAAREGGENITYYILHFRSFRLEGKNFKLYILL